MAAALPWGGAVLCFGIANAIRPSYAVAFLRAVASIYPGYHPTGSLHGAWSARSGHSWTGPWAGSYFGWLYNRFAAAGLA